MNQDEPATDVGRAFGDAVRDARGVAGISQRRLSELIMERTEAKLYPSAVTRIETGQREPKLSEALAIAKALGVSLSKLVGDTDDYATRFDQVISSLPVSFHQADEALKHAAAQLSLIATLLEEHPDLLDKMRFAGDRKPSDVCDYLRLVASGFRENRSLRSSNIAGDSETRDLIADVLVALASRSVPGNAEA